MTHHSSFNSLASGKTNTAGKVSVDWLNDLAEQLERHCTVTPQDFGAVVDGTTDDSAAFVAALAYLKERATTGYGYSYGAGRLYIPKGVYYLGTTTLDLTAAYIIEGETACDATGGASVLKWAANTTGIRIQRHNTQGAGSIGGNGVGGDGTIIRNLWLQGAYAGTEGEYHAIHAKARIRAESLFIYNFQGDGIHIAATAGSGDSIEGNANRWHVDSVTVQSCRNALYLNGADTNAGVSIGVNAIGCRQAGIYDSSFLSNTHIAAHAETCGIIAGSTTLCSYNGNRYYVLDPDLADTTAPSGDTSSNSAWAFHAVGDPTPDGALEWQSGMTWRYGGPYITDNANAGHSIIGCYSEGGQPVSQFTPPTVVIGEGHYAGAVRMGYGTQYGTWLTCGNLDGAMFQRDLGVQKNLLVYGEIRVDDTKVIGNQGAAVADATDNASAITQLNTLLARLRAHGLIAT